MSTNLEIENTTFIFKQKKSIGYIISSSLVLLFGIMWIQYFLFGGIILSVGSLFFIAHVDGIELDFENHKYRNVKIIGNQSFGIWKDFPQIKYISVFKTILKSSVKGLSGATVSNREKVILISFIYGKNQRLKVYKTENVEDAFFKAKYFSEKLNLRIYDATSKKGVWLD